MHFNGGIVGLTNPVTLTSITGAWTQQEQFLNRGAGTWPITIDFPVATDFRIKANDATSMTLSGSNVTQWNDVSGKGRHVSQGTAGSQPILVNSVLNGKPIVRFDGVDDILSTTAAITGTTYTMFFVGRINSALNTASNDMPFGVGAYGVTRAMRSFLRPTGADTITINSWSGQTASTLTFDSSGSPGYHIFGARGSSSGVQVGKDGTWQSFGGINYVTTTANVYVGGAYGNATYFTSMDLAEALFCSTYVTDIDIKVIEGYLAHTWGLTGLLPAGHPYKTVGI